MIKLVQQLPRHVLACLVHFDPSSAAQPDAKPQDFCSLRLQAPSFLQHVCDAVEVLLCFFQARLTAALREESRVESTRLSTRLRLGSDSDAAQVVLIMDKRHDKRHETRMAHAEWLRMRGALLRPAGTPAGQTGDRTALLGECVDLLDAALCKVLGPQRAQFKADFVTHGGDYHR